MAKFDRVGQLMGMLSRSLRRSYDKQLKDFGLTPCQLEVLTVLWEEDGILLSQIGRRVSRDGPTITGVIDRMEKKRLVKRKNDSHDRRAVRVLLTSKSKDMETQLSTTKKYILQKITRDLSSQELNYLESLLVKMMKNMEEEDLHD